MAPPHRLRHLLGAISAAMLACLPALDDTVEFFNPVLELKLDQQKKADLVDFMQAL